jgi:hypothetical protein
MAEDYTPLTPEQQTALAERLQTKWLQRMEKLLDSGEATATDMATLSRVLLQNGWSLDPKQLPQALRDKLTSNVSPEELEDDGILPIRRNA